MSEDTHTPEVERLLLEKRYVELQQEAQALMSKLDHNRTNRRLISHEIRMLNLARNGVKR